MRELVRKIMKSQGWDVVDRPDPVVVKSTEKGRNYYDIKLNLIALTNTDVGTLGHELCHSLQPAPKNYITPKKDKRGYFNQEVEIQSYAVQDWISTFKETGQPSWRDIGLTKPSRRVKKEINSYAKKVLGGGFSPSRSF